MLKKNITKLVAIFVFILCISFVGIGHPFADHRPYVNYYGIEMTDDEKIDFVAARILKKYKPAFLELAK